MSPFWPTTNCGSCNRAVYRNKAPNTCLVALCGRNLVEWSYPPPMGCLHLMTRQHNTKMARQWAGLIVAYGAQKEGLARERADDRMRLIRELHDRWEQEHAAEMGER